MAQPQPLPPLAAAVATRASESASVGPLRRQLPPLHLSPPKLSENATSSSSEREQGGKGKRKNSPKPGPQKRGGVSGGGVGTSPSSDSAKADPYGLQQKKQQQQRRQRQQATEMHPAQAPQDRDYVVGSYGGRRFGAVGNQMSAAERDEMKRANSINSASSASSTSSTRSISSTSTQSSCEYDLEEIPGVVARFLCVAPPQPLW